MARKNDDDIAVYDPYVQSLRRSHVGVLRKVLGKVSVSEYQSLTADEQKAMLHIFIALKVEGIEPLTAVEDEYSHLEGCTSS